MLTDSCRNFFGFVITLTILLNACIYLDIQISTGSCDDEQFQYTITPCQNIVSITPPAEAAPHTLCRLGPLVEEHRDHRHQDCHRDPSLQSGQDTVCVHTHAASAVSAMAGPLVQHLSEPSITARELSVPRATGQMWAKVNHFHHVFF